jgi:cell division protein FtsL|tara:strand:- start:348 stop:527 length:180 start_codon:yes stop_codon:yes gene_type:complete
MARKSALQRIDDHEKLCRIMQKQTFQQIQKIEDRLTRIEKMILGAAGAIILALLINMMN